MLEVGGFTPLSTTDWPGQLAAVVFVQGCPWRCHYCHNVELQPRAAPAADQAPDAPAAPRAVDWPGALRTLQRRQGLLDGVVFSGGEPTLDPALPDAMGEVRDLGFKVGLHTAGIYPDRLQAVLPLVDWVGFDLKAAWADYERVTAVPRSRVAVQDSLNRVMTEVRARGIGCEIRTTWHPALHDDRAMGDLGAQLAVRGVREWVWQTCRPTPAMPIELAAACREPSAALLGRMAQCGMRVVLR